MRGNTQTDGDLTQPAQLVEIAKYAAGIGPSKRLIIPAQTIDRNGDGKPDALNGDGLSSDADRVLGQPTSLIKDAHAAGLLVHLYTLRDDNFFLASDYQGDPKREYQQFIELGADGFFTDFPATGVSVRNSLTTPPAVANLGSSKGFEAMAISPDKSTLYPILEGVVEGDPNNALRIYKADGKTGKFQRLQGYYPLEDPNHVIGDITVINQNEYLVIERDNKQANEAQFKKIYKVDLSRQDAKGFVAKEEMVDLLNVKDPQDLNQDGSQTFKFPFQTIENVLVLDANTILVANDNNYPFTIGRPPAIDNSEILKLKLEKPLNLDP